MKSSKPKNKKWERLKALRKKISDKMSKIGKRSKLLIKAHFPERIWNKAQEGKKGHHRF